MTRKKKKPYYTAKSRTFAYVNCGHRHRTKRAAQQCADRQNQGSRMQGGTSHWYVQRYEG